MSGGFGMLLSFRLRGGAEVAKRVAGGLRLFKNATSLGGVESLVEHRAPVEGPGTRVPDDLLRLSVGIEAVEDLLADLEQALSRG
jgi:cystathionine gamma-synthase